MRKAILIPYIIKLIYIPFSFTLTDEENNNEAEDM